jgi:hypothetical protein
MRCSSIQFRGESVDVLWSFAHGSIEWCFGDERLNDIELTPEDETSICDQLAQIDPFDPFD